MQVFDMIIWHNLALSQRPEAEILVALYKLIDHSTEFQPLEVNMMTMRFLLLTDVSSFHFVNRPLMPKVYKMLLKIITL